jgi:anti-sigma regulatory factor (Ser/Thr protein kinase)
MSSDALGDALDGIVKEAPDHLVIDLVALEFMDSSGIAMLLRAAGNTGSIEIRNRTIVRARACGSRCVCGVTPFRRSLGLRVGSGASQAGTLGGVLRRERHLIHNTPAAPTLARRYVGEALASAPRDVSDVAALMVSELATNCVRYAKSDFTVSIEQTARTVRVDVADESGGDVAMRHPDPTDAAGRGLRIVEQRSDGWGVHERVDRAGKSVWFTLRL